MSPAFAGKRDKTLSKHSWLELPCSTEIVAGPVTHLSELAVACWPKTTSGTLQRHLEPECMSKLTKLHQCLS